MNEEQGPLDRARKSLDQALEITNTLLESMGNTRRGIESMRQASMTEVRGRVMTKEMLLAVIVQWFAEERASGNEVLRNSFFPAFSPDSKYEIQGCYDLTALADRIIEVGMLKPPIDLTGAVASEGWGE